MKIGRNMIAAIMITFCFTASLFLVLPIRSANSPYNPWLDYNDDGKIGLGDFVSFANSYNTAGNLTKTVSITSYNWTEGKISFTMSGSYFSPNIPTGGFRTVGIAIDVSSTDNRSIIAHIGFVFANETVNWANKNDAYTIDYSYITGPMIPNFQFNFRIAYDVAFSGINVYLVGPFDNYVGTLYYYLST